MRVLVRRTGTRLLAMAEALNQEEEIQERPFNLALTLRLVAYLKQKPSIGRYF